MPRPQRRFALLYVLWIVVCGLLFAALDGREDPSRRRDRILSGDAAHRALTILRRTNQARYDGYEVVHVAWARKGEGGPENRWIVLCDRVPHTALREAMVVEVRGEDGRLIRLRKPQG